EREGEAAPVARREQLGLAASSAVPHRPDRVDHALRREAVAACDLRVSGGAAAERAAFAQQLGPRCAVNRTVDPAASEKRVVRCVDDRVDLERRDIGFDRPQSTGHAAYRKCFPSHQATPAMKAEQGMVRIQAMTMLPATPQRTAPGLCTDPTPTMAPVMVCVVETGMPSAAVVNSVSPPPVSAQNPSTGLSLVIF